MAAPRKVMFMMALVLASATVATAVTSFAAPKKKKPVAQEQVASSTQVTSQRMLRLKIRSNQNTY